MWVPRCVCVWNVFDHSSTQAISAMWIERATNTHTRKRERCEMIHARTRNIHLLARILTYTYGTRMINSKIVVWSKHIARTRARVCVRLCITHFFIISRCAKCIIADDGTSCTPTDRTSDIVQKLPFNRLNLSDLGHMKMHDNQQFVWFMLFVSASCVCVSHNKLLLKITINRTICFAAHYEKPTTVSLSWKSPF